MRAAELRPSFIHFISLIIPPCQLIDLSLIRVISLPHRIRRIYLIGEQSLLLILIFYLLLSFIL